MSFRPCQHSCNGACIVRSESACSVVCHRQRDYMPPDPDSPIGRYLALVHQAGGDGAGATRGGGAR